MIERIGTPHIGYQTLFDEEAALRRTGTRYVASRYRTMKANTANTMNEALQAMHALVLHGRYVCTARRPRCGACVLAPYCPSREA